MALIHTKFSAHFCLTFAKLLAVRHQSLRYTIVLQRYKHSPIISNFYYIVECFSCPPVYPFVNICRILAIKMGKGKTLFPKNIYFTASFNFLINSCTSSVLIPAKLLKARSGEFSIILIIIS